MARLTPQQIADGKMVAKAITSQYTQAEVGICGRCGRRVGYTNDSIPLCEECLNHIVNSRIS